MFGNRRGVASKRLGVVAPIAGTRVEALALTTPWNILFRISLKLPPSIPGEQDVQTISATVHPKYGVPLIA